LEMALITSIMYDTGCSASRCIKHPIIPLWSTPFGYFQCLQLTVCGFEFDDDLASSAWSHMRQVIFG
jgi:hypothetical protein